jgi:sugar lactone lactonase YvrE
MHRRAEVVSAGGYALLEAPRWHAGALYASDITTHRVLRFDGEQVTTICEVPNLPGGLGFLPDGDLLVVSMLDSRILRFDGAELHAYASLGHLTPGPANDLVVDSRGGLYVGNFGGPTDGPLQPTVLLRVEPTGGVSAVAGDIVFPNGMAITSDGATLLVAETFAGRITAFSIRGDGTLWKRRTWAQFGESPSYVNYERAKRELPVLPDGICLDREHRLWIADPKGGGGAICVTEGGTVVDSVDTGDLTAYSVALGGESGFELFLCCAPPLGYDPSTEQAALLRATVDVPALVKC